MNNIEVVYLLVPFYPLNLFPQFQLGKGRCWIPAWDRVRVNGRRWGEWKSKGEGT